MLKNLIALSVTILFLAVTPPEAGAVHKNKLNVEIDINKSRLTGTSRVGVKGGEEIVVQHRGLEILKIVQDDKELPVQQRDGYIIVMPEKYGVVEIFYQATYDNSSSTQTGRGFAANVIDNRGVSLTGIWYPIIGDLNYYDLTVTLPVGYEAISEAEEIRKKESKERVEFQFVFSHPVDGINLVASDRYTIVKDNHENVEIYAYFFREDLHLAKTYIEYTKKYLKFYEDLIGPYPYKRFAIVENFLPTGYSMPTYTLLGSSVVRLPFIVKTSLGHEILHQWFGNLVYIDHETGNWAEGLTTYLADYLYLEQENKGMEYRKQMLISYMSYVDAEHDLPLKYFKGGTDKASRAIGYGKTAMVFHMLKNIVGKEVFYDSLRDVINEYSFRKASWDNFRTSFEKKYGQDLQWFFSQWTEKEGLFELRLHGTELTQKGEEYELHFHIDQEGSLFQLALPITIYYKDQVSFDTLRINDEENSFELTLPEAPSRIVLDEDYDIARGLNRDEYPPVISGLLGEDELIVAVPEGGEILYGKIIEKFVELGAVEKPVEDITIADIEAGSLVLFGNSSQLVQRLYGSISGFDAGFQVTVKKNPWNREKIIAVFDGTSRDEVDAAYRKVRHYGKYSRLAFDNGIIKEKEIAESQRGIVMELKEDATAIDMSAVNKLSDVITKVAEKKIVYVGEVHNVFAHHAVQLDIITGIYKKNKNIAIGMEMFQRPFQETLDSFISGTLGEQAFLKESEYYKRWSFDYHLYKPILDFARTEKIPLVALNLKREIIEKVSANGLDFLDDQEKEEIPAELDFTDAAYRERLEEVFTMHTRSHERNFNNFYQSQILWDETMSESVDNYLRENPDRQMIVLAGQGHLRYRSGIPARTYRRNSFDYATILIDEDVKADIGDFIIFPKTVEGITTPKLMVFLEEIEDRVKVSGFPDASVSERAGLKERDIILSINDVEVRTVGDLKIQLLYKKKGDSVRLRVLRKVMFLDKNVDIEIEL